MYDELVKRLREAPYDWPDADLHYEAADAIEKLSKELIELKLLTCCCTEPPKEET